ncbi:DUF4917 family protein [Pseudomonas sp. MH9.2]|uniref:DUF4917 family protein n=1 Tax=unclassified Pseudomonas TaxID=196821 RepID=UPI002AC950B6|nr:MULTISPECIES: DUF4917 family protein [unclassified Pseudomonas]MEB0024587.1 DUF4917 family protein [Pseudomonas sp. MH9.2]MEE3504973.1 DUF4917 family protein [Pseudomonas sp. 10C3]WPX70849.1 DUF4917 family protein [Pseudomonas sp. MH9.2]
MDFTDFDAELADWNELRATTPFSGLLIGNGASMAVWKNFSYDSLFEKAETTRNKPLSHTELAVFKAINTSNFEPILSALKTTMRVNAALTISSSSPRNRYFAIKEALIHAVRSVHIPWRLVEESTLTRLNQELSQYRTVYSTNYDLLCYWAVMQSPQAFNDLFDDDATFDLSNTPTNATRILYLHGGLHLVKNLDGSVRKLLSSESTLLGSFAINALDDVPLFISEDNSENKLKMIRHSDYLSFCYSQLATHEDALCIFGHALGTQDKHIVDAIRHAGVKTIALSIYPRSAAFIQHQKRHYSSVFAGLDVTLKFFDAKTHPLGSPELSVPVERLNTTVSAPKPVGSKR